MKLDFLFLLIFVSICGNINGQHVLTIGSPFVQEEPNHKFLVVSHKMDSSSSIKFSLGDQNAIKTLAKKMTSVVELKYSDHMSISNELNITTEHKDKCTQHTINLIDTRKSPKIFIQFDKPTYKTGDNFNFRVYILNKKMQPSTENTPVDVSIFDSKNYLIKKFSHINENRSIYGVYEGSLKLADSPNLGKWKIQVSTVLMNRDIIKTFDVQKPSEENFEIYLEMTPIVAFIDKRVYLTIWVKDNTDKFFSGTASVSVSAKFKNSQRIEIDRVVKVVDIVGARQLVIVDFDDDLGIRFPTDDMILKFTVQVTDKIAQRSSSVWKEIEMKHKGKNTIQVVRKEYFKPGFKLITRVKVKVLDGRPDNSFNQLSITNEYYGKNPQTGKPLVSKKSFKVNLKNGEVNNVLQTKPEMDKIIVHLEFAGAKLTETILPLPSFKTNEYMQVTMLNKSTNVNDKIFFSAHTTGEMETLHVVVFGLDGIIHVEEFPEAEGKDIYPFTIILTESMKPEARIFVFYVHEKSGVLIYDELSISLGFSIDNSLEISLEKQSAPRAKTNIMYKTQEGSKMFLSATDQIPATINRENEISRGDIYNELVYYLNLKFKNSSFFHLERINSFILPTLKTGASCDSGTSNVLSQQLSENDAAADGNPINYFPDVWSSEPRIAKTSEMQSFKLDVPDSLVSWRFFGTSVHPEKGFTVAKVQPRIVIKSDISVQLKTPPHAYVEEVLWIDFSIYNSLSADINAQVYVSIENGFFMDTEQQRDFGILCLDFKKLDKKDKSFEVEAPKEKSSETTTIWIRPDGNGDVSIRVMANAGEVNDEVIKVIKLERKIQKKLISSNMVELNGRKRTESIQGRDEDVILAVYGSLLGPALNGLENLFNSPLKSDEEKILKFTAATISYKYLKMVNGPNEEKLEKLMNDMNTGYQEALAILEKIQQKSENIDLLRLTTLTAHALIDAQHLIQIDQNIIKIALELIENNQYDNDLVRTAEVIAAFVKDSEIKEFFKSKIEKSTKSLKSVSGRDYPKALAAYTLALNGDTEDAKKLINLMDNTFLKLDASHLFSQFNEIASYTILTKILINLDPTDEVKWLLEKRNADGGFYSPYNTVLALRALYEYSKYKNLKSVNFKISPNHFEIKNPANFEVFELKNQQRLSISGEGTGYIQMYQNIIQEPKNTSDYFMIDAHRTDVENDHMNIDINLGVTKPIQNLVVVEVELPRGYKFVSHNLEQNLVSVDVRNDRNLVVFYISSLENEQTLTVKAVKVFEISNHQPSMIKVYEYYRSNIMDNIHYVHDRKEENCERIRVLKLIKAAEDAQSIARDAEKLTQEAEDSIATAKSHITNADGKYKNANENIKSAQAKMSDIQAVFDDATTFIADAQTIAENAEELTESTAQATYPPEKDISEEEEYPECFNNQEPQTDEIKDQEESEAVRAQGNADDMDNKLKIAECVATKARTNSENAKKDFDEKQRQLRTARQQASKALEEVKNTKRESQQLKNQILSKQRVINQMKPTIQARLTEAERALEEIESSRSENDQADQKLLESQEKVHQSLEDTKVTLTLAQNAYKASEAQDNVTSASKTASQTKSNAESTKVAADNAKSKSFEAFTRSNMLEVETSKTKGTADQIHQQTEAFKEETEKVKSNSQKAELDYKNALKQVDDHQRQANEAQHKHQLAVQKENAKNKARDDAKTEAEEARKSANQERETEVQKAKDYASNADQSATQAENLASEISEIARLLTQEVKTLTAARKTAAKIIWTFNLPNQASSKSDEAGKIKQIEDLVKQATIANQNAQGESRKSRKAASNSDKSAKAAENSSDARELVRNVKKSQVQAESAKRSMEQTQKDKDNAEAAKLRFNEMKTISDGIKRCANDARNMIIQLPNKKTISDALNAIKAARNMYEEISELEQKQQVESFGFLETLETKINSSALNINRAYDNSNVEKKKGYGKCEEIRKTTELKELTLKSAEFNSFQKKFYGERSKIVIETQQIENNKKLAEKIKIEAQQKLMTIFGDKANEQKHQVTRIAAKTDQEVSKLRETKAYIRKTLNNIGKSTEPASRLRGGRNQDIETSEEPNISKNVEKAVKDLEKAAKDIDNLKVKIQSSQDIGEANRLANQANQIKKTAEDAYEVTINAAKIAEEVKTAVDAAKEAHDESSIAKNQLGNILSLDKIFTEIIQSAQDEANKAQEFGADQMDIDETLKIDGKKTTFDQIKLDFDNLVKSAESLSETAVNAAKDAHEAAQAANSAEDIETAEKEAQNAIGAKENAKEALSSINKLLGDADKLNAKINAVKTKVEHIKTEAEIKNEAINAANADKQLNQSEVVESAPTNSTNETVDGHETMNNELSAKEDAEGEKDEQKSENSESKEDQADNSDAEKPDQNQNQQESSSSNSENTSEHPAESNGDGNSAPSDSKDVNLKQDDSEKSSTESTNDKLNVDQNSSESTKTV